MIAALRFDEAGRPRFEASTNVRIDAVCAVANSVTDHLSRLLEREIAIDVFEPTFVPLGAQPALFAGAYVYRAHARRCDLLVVLRAGDARRLTSCAFRDTDANADRALSAHEERVLDRIARELGNLCAPLCGEITSFDRAGASADRYECATYFELRVASPVDVRIGIGLSRDPAPPAGVTLGAAALADVRVDLRARVARARMTARELATLRVGSVVPFETALAEPATLLAGDVAVARGECGLHDGALAFNVTERTGSPA